MAEISDLHRTWKPPPTPPVMDFETFARNLQPALEAFYRKWAPRASDVSVAAGATEVLGKLRRGETVIIGRKYAVAKWEMDWQHLPTALLHGCPATLEALTSFLRQNVIGGHCRTGGAPRGSVFAVDDIPTYPMALNHHSVDTGFPPWAGAPGYSCYVRLEVPRQHGLEGKTFLPVAGFKEKIRACAANRQFYYPRPWELDVTGVVLERRDHTWYEVPYRYY